MKSRLLLSFSLILSLYILFPVTVKAAGNCQAIYGGGLNCSNQNPLTIIKTVLNPQTEQYTHNLLQNSYIFKRGEIIKFKLSITNSSNSDASNLQVTDIIPINLDYVSGTNAVFNNKNRTATLKISVLKAKETKDLILVTKVNSLPLPNNQTSACFANQANVLTTSFFIFKNIQSQDTGIFCLTTTQSATVSPTGSVGQIGTTPGGTPIYPSPHAVTNPPTGATSTGIIALLALYLLGMYARKRARA